MERRARTRQLIELGGLVIKSGLVNLTDDDRTAIYGALIEVVARAHDAGGDQHVAMWRRRGKRAFEADARER